MSAGGAARGRVAVIGLDCAEPSLVFDRFADELPNISQLIARGTWGPLRSVDPPITVPAWSCMLTGRDPGELGIYGFRNRITDTMLATQTLSAVGANINYTLGKLMLVVSGQYGRFENGNARTNNAQFNLSLNRRF